MVSLVNLDEASSPSALPGSSYPNPKDVCAEAGTIKDRLASRYDEVNGFVFPAKDGIRQTATSAEIYDDTAMLAAPEAASRIQEGVVPNFTRWAKFIAGALITDEEEKLEVNQALAVVEGYLFEMVNASNFITEVHDTLQDCLIGTGALRIDKGKGLSPFNSRAVPLRNLSFCIGPDGRPDPIIETRLMTPTQIKLEYGVTLPEHLVAQTPAPVIRFEVTEIWSRDWEEPEAYRYQQLVSLPGYDHYPLLTEEHKGAGCNPYIVARWSKASGEGWGRGPLLNVLPSIRVVNFAMQAVLDHSDIALGGIWQAEDDGVINVETVKLEPGVIIPKAPGSAGLTALTPGGDFQVSNFLITEHRENIRRALYADSLGDPNRSPKTATEVDQRMRELARALGSAFGRLLFEFAMPAVGRFLYILKDLGRITLPSVDGREIALLSSSPLAMSQRFQDIDAIDRFTALLNARFGQDVTNIVVDAMKASRFLGERFDVNPTILRSEEQTTMLLQQLMSQAGGEQGGTEQGMGEAAA